LLNSKDPYNPANRLLLLNPGDYPNLAQGIKITSKQPRIRRDWCNYNRVITTSLISGQS